ncbi:hypothetical protein [Albidovulum sp.]|uniref:hypothetical protein n=1 Tax=Albidovulum sp. TaxID=1872424 RepID=UPI0039B8F7C3
MDYVYFDLEAVRKALLEAAAVSQEIALAEAGSDLEREHILAEAAFVPVIAEAVVLIVQMMNQRRPDQFIGVVFGNFLGTLAANAIGNAEEPGVMYDAITRVFDKVLAAHLDEDDEDVVMSVVRLVPGEVGGRE